MENLREGTLYIEEEEFIINLFQIALEICPTCPNALASKISTANDTVITGYLLQHSKQIAFLLNHHSMACWAYVRLISTNIRQANTRDMVDSAVIRTAFSQHYEICEGRTKENTKLCHE